MLLTLRIGAVLPATPRARIVHLDLGPQAFSYLPGQAVMIARRGHERRKPYSIAGAPEDTARDRSLELLVGVDESGSAGPHLALEPGAEVDVDGPLGRFTFPSRPDVDRFVFIAGGTGIAPLRAMLRHALNEPHRQIGLFYSARTLGEFAYERELQSLARDGRIEFRQTVTREVVPGDWNGGRGRIGRDELAPLIHDPATLCFICGPPALVEEMARVLDELGITRDRIRIEEWSGGTDDPTRRPSY